MAEAMIAPLVTNPNIEERPQILVNDVSAAAVNKLKGNFPTIQTHSTLTQQSVDVDVVVVAVKPQNCSSLFSTLQPLLSDSINDPVILSICAGVPIWQFCQGLSTDKVVRTMPNTPATIQQGVTVWTANGGASYDGIFTSKEVELCRELLKSCGMEVQVEDEKFIDMATSISGSGPAYVFLLIESMVDTAVHMGFSREVATRLVLQTILGSTLYAEASTTLHPAELRNSVTSPAGTTASAVYELERGGFRSNVSNAIWACYRRSLEMGGRDSNVGPGRVGELPSGEFGDMK
ncbi:hypothetical protein TrCOL_g4601 [Triparma columacea]|uniref:Pyrroline-5-carboxylate reductase n=1 Tax=Triparma columacea TaxID=722753 RepID=A0A9W7G0E1_9STRA|nr:hypothetical protein TrCOL_g4601 [Triparma columacea]